MVYDVQQKRGNSFLPFDVSAIAPEDVEDNEQMEIRKLPQLGLQMLPGRRVRFGGKTLQGITLPKGTSKLLAVIEMILSRYGPCLEIQNGTYQMNDDCFAKKENEFLKILSESLANLKFRYVL